MNKSVKRRADACLEEGLRRSARLRMNLQSQSEILSYHDESEEEEGEQEAGSEEERVENEDEREEGEDGLEEVGEDGEVEEGVEQEEGENEEGEDEEGIYIGQNEMADDYTVDELFRMGKKNDFPKKKVIFNKKRIFYRAFLHFFNHKRVLKFILIVSSTFYGNTIKKILLKRSLKYYLYLS